MPKYFMTLKKTWMLSNLQPSLSNQTTEQAWQATSKQLFSSTKVVRKLGYPLKWWLRAAAVAAILLSVSLFLWKPWQVDSAMAQHATSNTTNAIDLPDGSLVTLNQASSITFHTDLETNQRKAVLSGDGFFEIKEDITRPFAVQAGDLSILVLGTSFYVDTRANADTQMVIVQSGKVQVEFQDSAIVLGKGEKACFDISFSFS